MVDEIIFFDIVNVLYICYYFNFIET